MTQSRSVSRALVIGLALLLIAGCTSRGGNIPYNVSDFGVPDAPKLASVDDTYKLGPLDTVSVMVFQVADLSRDYQIDQSGRITMPLIGPVDAVGLTTADLGKAIADRLDAKYMHNSNVTIALKASNRVVTVDGSVKGPGVFQATGPLTLLQAVALAHGTDDLANPHRVAVFRVIGGKRMAAAFDLYAIRRGKEPDPAIYAGDTVIVDGSGLRKAQKDILQALPLTTLFLAF